VIVGIDLGTSRSEVACLKGGTPMIIPEVPGADRGILPSVVAVDTDGQVRVGAAAEALLIPKPDRAVQEIKRLMGSEERVRLGAEEFTPQEISAMILRHLKEAAEAWLGERVSEAVVTVPAYFNDRQRRATYDAAEIAGLKVRRLIAEPTAAAIAYGLERPGVEEKVVVYDLGGGTLDVTVLELSEGVIDVLASAGNSQLGGKNFDERLLEFLRRECERQAGVDPFSGPERVKLRNRQKFKAAARQAKEQLSFATATEISIENVGQTAEGEPIDFVRALDRAEFEPLIADLVESTREQLDQALAHKQVRTGEIDTVLLVGGSTRIPAVRTFVSEYFGGRALRAEVNPDEAVALGAAVLSGIESRSVGSEQLVVQDVLPFTLGIATAETGYRGVEYDVFSPIIRKNSTIPRTAVESYRTMVDFQERILVRVYQGDRPRCSENDFVGEFFHENLTPAPAGLEVEVEMSYNLNGMVEVVAREPGATTPRETRCEMRPNRTSLTPDAKRQAKARVDHLWTASAGLGAAPAAAAPPRAASWEASPLFAKVAPLLGHAEKSLAKLDGAAKVQVNHLVNEVKAALAANDGGALAKAEQALIDALFELD
jgi:molecular chaperone DnaK